MKEKQTERERQLNFLMKRTPVCTQRGGSGVNPEPSEGGGLITGTDAAAEVVQHTCFHSGPLVIPPVTDEPVWPLNGE